jgi:hypothetical protein
LLDTSLISWPRFLSRLIFLSLVFPRLFVLLYHFSLFPVNRSQHPACLVLQEGQTFAANPECLESLMCQYVSLDVSYVWVIEKLNPFQCSLQIDCLPHSGVVAYLILSFSSDEKSFARKH